MPSLNFLESVGSSMPTIYRCFYQALLPQNGNRTGAPYLAVLTKPALQLFLLLGISKCLPVHSLSVKSARVMFCGL